MSKTPAMHRHVGVVSGFTFLSRLAGLTRDVVIAYAFGTQAVADAFYVAFRIPNLMRRLLAEGAFTMAFVPIYTEYKNKSVQAAEEAANAIGTALLTVLTGLVGLGVLAAPWLVHLVAHGFAADPVKFALTVDLTRLMFPYLMLASLTALLMGMLNSWRHFVAPAAAPIFLNLAMIAGVTVIGPQLPRPIVGLAIGVLLGGCCQLVLQLAPLARRTRLPRVTRSLRHPSLRQLLVVMVPSVYGGAVYQLNVLVITLLASFLPTGSVSYLWYADRITEFPLGIFAVAVATVALPTLAAHHARKEIEAFRDTMTSGLRVLVAGTVPAAVGLYILAAPIVRLLFESGAFDAESTIATVAALQLFVLGIPCVSAVRNIVPAFYAMRDAKTPAVVATVTLIVNAVAGGILMQWMAHVGLAAGMVIASITQCALLFGLLHRRIGFTCGPLIRSGVGSGIAAAGMACFLVWVQGEVDLSPHIARMALLPRILGIIAGGAAVYFAILAFTAPTEAQYFRNMLRKHKS
jgi:putative peptidoglycan lipid II flippase